MFQVSPENPELGSVGLYSIKTKTALLIKHFEIIEGVFEDESEALTKLCEEEYERTKDDEDDENYYSGYIDSLREIEFVYLRMHRYASILASYSYLESSMSKVCAQKELELKIPISVEDLKGDGVVRCKNYLEKLCSSEFSSINGLWSEILTLNKVRNCIIHCSGDVEKMNGSEGFIKIVNANNGLSFIEQKLLMVSSEFVLKSIKNVSTLLVYLVAK